MTNNIKLNPKLDLVFERTTSLSPEQIWQGWTHPPTLMKWFCPRPWKVIDCKMDLYPGGQFYSVMQSPEGQGFPNHGVYLEVVENKKLIWTNSMIEGYRPVHCLPGEFHFTATLLISKLDKGTHYKAIVAHADEDGYDKHVKMGFQEGWGKAFEQLEEVFNVK